jgi:hypothetical protein
VCLQRAGAGAGGTGQGRRRWVGQSAPIGSTAAAVRWQQRRAAGGSAGVGRRSGARRAARRARGPVGSRAGRQQLRVRSWPLGQPRKAEAAAGRGDTHGPISWPSACGAPLQNRRLCACQWHNHHPSRSLSVVPATSCRFERKKGIGLALQALHELLHRRPSCNARLIIAGARRTACGARAPRSRLSQRLRAGRPTRPAYASLLARCRLRGQAG